MCQSLTVQAKTALAACERENSKEFISSCMTLSMAFVDLPSVCSLVHVVFNTRIFKRQRIVLRASKDKDGQRKVTTMVSYHLNCDKQLSIAP